jgi:hypothetical protein
MIFFQVAGEKISIAALEAATMFFYIGGNSRFPQSPHPWYAKVSMRVRS